MQHVAGAHLLAGGDGAVVHALVADQLLQQLDGLAGQRVVHDFGVWRVRNSVTRRIDSARCVGPRQSFWISRLGARLAISSLVAAGCGLSVPGCSSSGVGQRRTNSRLTEKTKSPPNMLWPNFRITSSVSARIARQHGLGEAADRLVPGVTVLVQADRVLEHGGGDPLGRQLAERQAVGAADAAAHDVKAAMAEMVHQRQVIAGVGVPAVGLGHRAARVAGVALVHADHGERSGQIGHGIHPGRRGAGVARALTPVFELRAQAARGEEQQGKTRPVDFVVDLGVWTLEDRHRFPLRCRRAFGRPQ